mmetsp:Transcript_25361/g.47175  ORF Transcript_25361/g.47175 Transcript_25361/m.47175 type:complete len:540 (+) Transcript_25361:523-2142(+)
MVLQVHLRRRAKGRKRGGLLLSEPAEFVSVSRDGGHLVFLGQGCEGLRLEVHLVDCRAHVARDNVARGHAESVLPPPLRRGEGALVLEELQLLLLLLQLHLLLLNEQLLLLLLNGLVLLDYGASRHAVPLDLVLEENLAHLGGPLPQGLRRLLPGARVADLVPESGRLVLAQEPSSGVADGPYDRTGDGRLVVLLRLEVSAPVGVDEVAEAAVARVDVGPAAAAGQNVVVGVRGDGFRARGYELGGSLFGLDPDQALRGIVLGGGGGDGGIVVAVRGHDVRRRLGRGVREVQVGRLEAHPGLLLGGELDGTGLGLEARALHEEGLLRDGRRRRSVRHHLHVRRRHHGSHGGKRRDHAHHGHGGGEISRVLRKVVGITSAHHRTELHLGLDELEGSRDGRRGAVLHQLVVRDRRGRGRHRHRGRSLLGGRFRVVLGEDLEDGPSGRELVGEVQAPGGEIGGWRRGGGAADTAEWSKTRVGGGGCGIVTHIAEPWPLGRPDGPHGGGEGSFAGGLLLEPSAEGESSASSRVSRRGRHGKGR